MSETGTVHVQDMWSILTAIQHTPKISRMHMREYAILRVRNLESAQWFRKISRLWDFEIT